MNKVPADPFGEITQRVIAARQNALQSANTVLLDLYWQIGESISHKIKQAEWTENAIEQLAQHLAFTQPGLHGFTTTNLFRMRQFYETYQNHHAVGVLVKLLPWSHNLIILSHCKCAEEREFYLRIALQEAWSSRELERHCQSNLFERVVLLPRKIVPMLLYNHTGIAAPLSDAYMREFLGVPVRSIESTAHHKMLEKLSSFLAKLSSDFCFIGCEYPIQILEWDFTLDLLFFHRGLNALLLIELKIGEFETEYLKQLSFNLEMLDNHMKKAHEQPSIGLLLCINQDSCHIEYAFHQSLLPRAIAECEKCLPTKATLQEKLKGIYAEEENEVIM